MRSKSPNEAVILAWARLIRAQAAALGAVEAALKAAGFPPLSWYDVLLELRRAGPAGLRPMEIEQRLLIAQHNVSRMIERLVKAGYAQRRAFADDGRGQVVTITRAGDALLRLMWPAYGAAIQRHVGARLDSETEAAKLAELLGKLIAVVPRDSQNPTR